MAKPTTQPETFGLLIAIGSTLVAFGLIIALVKVPHHPGHGLPMAGSWRYVAVGGAISWIGTLVLIAPLTALGIRIAVRYGWIAGPPEPEAEGSGISASGDPTADR